MGALGNEYLYKKLVEEQQAQEMRNKMASKNSFFNKNIIGGTQRMTGSPLIGALAPTMAAGMGKTMVTAHTTDAALQMAGSIPYLFLKAGQGANYLNKYKQLDLKFQSGLMDNYSGFSHTMHNAMKVQTASAGASAAAAALGHTGAAQWIAAHNPMLMAFHGLGPSSGLGSLTGAIGKGTAGLLGLKGGAATALGTLGSFAPMALALGGLMYGAHKFNKMGGSDTTIQNKKIRNETPKVNGIQKLISEGSYKTHANTIQMLQAQNLLDPFQTLQLTILNDINLNTTANKLSYIEKHTKSTDNARVSNELANRFYQDEFRSSSLSGSKNLNKNIWYNVNQGISLGSFRLFANLMGPLSRVMFGQHVGEINSQIDSMLTSDSRNSFHNALTKSANKLNIPHNLLSSVHASANDFLKYESFEDQLLGLTANIHEISRTSALALLDIRTGMGYNQSTSLGDGAKTSAFSIIGDTKDYLKRTAGVKSFEDKSFAQKYFGSFWGTLLEGGLSFAHGLSTNVLKETAKLGGKQLDKGLVKLFGAGFSDDLNYKEAVKQKKINNLLKLAAKKGDINEAFNSMTNSDYDLSQSLHIATILHKERKKEHFTGNYSDDIEKALNGLDLETEINESNITKEHVKNAEKVLDKINNTIRKLNDEKKRITNPDRLEEINKKIKSFRRIKTIVESRYSKLNLLWIAKKNGGIEKAIQSGKLNSDKDAFLAYKEFDPTQSGGSNSYVQNLLNPFLDPFRQMRSSFINYKENLARKLRNSFNIYSQKDIEKLYDDAKSKLRKVDYEKSGREFLGKKFPDMMIQILNELKTQSSYLKDLLRCNGCSVKQVKGLISGKWRGQFGDIMTDSEYDRRLSTEALSQVEGQLETGKSKRLIGGLTKHIGINLLKLMTLGSIKAEEFNTGSSVMKKFRMYTRLNDDQLQRIQEKENKEKEFEKELKEKVESEKKSSKTLEVIETTVKKWFSFEKESKKDSEKKEESKKKWLENLLVGGLGLSLGGLLYSGFGYLAEHLDHMIDSAYEWMQDNSSTLKSVAATLGGIGAAYGIKKAKDAVFGKKQKPKTDTSEKPKNDKSKNKKTNKTNKPKNNKPNKIKKIVKNTKRSLKGFWGIFLEKLKNVWDRALDLFKKKNPGKVDKKSYNFIKTIKNFISKAPEAFVKLFKSFRSVSGFLKATKIVRAFFSMLAVGGAVVLGSAGIGSAMIAIFTSFIIFLVTDFLIDIVIDLINSTGEAENYEAQIVLESLNNIKDLSNDVEYYKFLSSLDSLGNIDAANTLVKHYTRTGDLKHNLSALIGGVEDNYFENDGIIFNFKEKNKNGAKISKDFIKNTLYNHLRFNDTSNVIREMNAFELYAKDKDDIKNMQAIANFKVIVEMLDEKKKQEIFSSPEVFMRNFNDFLKQPDNWINSHGLTGRVKKKNIEFTNKFGEDFNKAIYYENEITPKYKAGASAISEVDFKKPLEEAVQQITLSISEAASIITSAINNQTVSLSGTLAATKVESISSISEK